MVNFGNLIHYTEYQMSITMARFCTDCKWSLVHNRYTKTSLYPPRNEITVKLGIAEPVLLTGGQWYKYSEEKEMQEKLKNPWKPSCL